MAQARANYADNKNIEIKFDEVFDHRGKQWRRLVKGTDYHIDMDPNSWQPKIAVWLHKPMLNMSGEEVYPVGTKFENMNNHPWDRAKMAAMGRLPWEPGEGCECKFCVRRRSTGTIRDDVPGPEQLPNHSETFEQVSETPQKDQKPKRKAPPGDGLVENCEQCGKTFDGGSPGRRRNQRRLHMKKHAPEAGQE